MALAAGVRLGPYEIHSAIGAGGMGEVYRARDTKLGRDVALKILPEAFALDPDRLARFKREAQILASLNHPHIAAIHGFEESGGVQALVLELVEGPTLADRIAQGPLPVDEALTIAKQIAEALEAAHEQGIIHRDLKPANIKLRADGTATVLDFGLAKALEPLGAGIGTSSAMSQSPTITTPAMTQAGVILGTAAYMSPEQAKGRAADRRSDIWAFGCVLYEMLTGRRAFDGEDMVDVLGAVARLEPDCQRLPRETPERVRVLLQRCLRKDRTLRLQAAGDARVEIQEALLAPAAEPAHIMKLQRVSQRRAVFLVGAITLTMGAAIGSGIVWALRSVSSSSIVRVAVPLPSGERLPVLVTSVLAVSPDGSGMAFISGRSGGQQIYVRSFDSAEAKAIPGTEGADGLAFSPDGRWLVVSVGGRLVRLPIDGGSPLTVHSALNVRGLSWGDDNTIVFAPSFGSGGLMRIPVSGGTPQPVTTVARGSELAEEAHRWPQVLPGGQAVVFTAWTRNLDEAQIVVQRLDSEQRRVVVRGGTYARYVPTGHLVYVRGATLFAVPFNLSRLEATGDPVPLTESVRLTAEGAAQFDVAANGSLVHVPGGLQGSDRELTWVDRSGREEPVGAPRRAYITPRLSPDGQKIALAIQGANDDVWTYDIPRRTLTRLTFESRSITPFWTPDGKQVIYRSVREGVLNLFMKAADGSGDEERLTVGDANQTASGVSQDGRLLAFTQAGDLWIVSLGGDKAARPFIRTPFDEGSGVFSPDGRWLAYRSNESGRNEVYVQAFPGGGQKVQISREGGADPRWAQSGELFYRTLTTMMVVRLSAGATLVVGEPQALFDISWIGVQGGSPFDVTADGQRFLVIKETEQVTSTTHINVAFNWFEELKRLVPAN